MSYIYRLLYMEINPRSHIIAFYDKFTVTVGLPHPEIIPVTNEKGGQNPTVRYFVFRPESWT